MEHLIIAIILLIGPNHELLGGAVLPGASTDMTSCYKKAAAFIQQLGPQTPNTAVPACAALATDTST